MLVRIYGHTLLPTITKIMQKLKSTIQIASVLYTLLLTSLSWNNSTKNKATIPMLQKLNQHNVSSGSTVRLQCSLQSSGDVYIGLTTFNDDVKYLVNKSELVKLPTKYFYNFKNSSEDVLHVLEIKNVNKSDEGKYICVQRFIVRQVTLKVFHVPRGPPSCQIFPDRYPLNNETDEQAYRLDCTAKRGDLQVSISLFVNDELVKKSTKGVSEDIGNYNEITLSFLSHTDSIFSGTSCKVVHGLPSSPFHEEQTCYYYPLLVSSTVHWTSKDVTQENNTTFQVVPIIKSPNDTPHGIQLITLTGLVVGFLLLSFLLTFVGFKVIQRLTCRNDRMRESYGYWGTEPTQDVETERHNRNSDVTTLNELTVPHQTDQSPSEFNMITNGIYESCNRELLNGITMVENEIYESVRDSNISALEMYSTIQRL